MKKKGISFRSEGLQFDLRDLNLLHYHLKTGELAEVVPSHAFDQPGRGTPLGGGVLAARPRTHRQSPFSLSE